MCSRPPLPHSNPRLHISDTLVARVAAYHASRVPGVIRLYPTLASKLGASKLGGPSLAQSMRSIATRLLPTRGIPIDGVSAIVDDNHTEINITLVTQWGYNCRDLAEQVQNHVAEQLHAYTGLPATVRITIAIVDYGP